MKLLIDQNISHRILPILDNHFSSIHHVRELGLINASDHEIFMFAREHDYDAVITLDDDFVKLLNVFSFPPKIIWLRTGNCTTPYLASILNSKFHSLKEFVRSEEHFLYEIVKQ